MPVNEYVAPMALDLAYDNLGDIVRTEIATQTIIEVFFQNISNCSMVANLTKFVLKFTKIHTFATVNNLNRSDNICLFLLKL